DVANRRAMPTVGPQKWVSCLEFSPDGRLLAAAIMDGMVDIWEPSSGRLAAQLKGHVMGVLRAGFFPDGKTLVTGGLDGRVKLWMLATFQEFLTLTFPLGAAFRSLSMAPDGRTLAVGYMGLPGHHVQLFSAPRVEKIESASRPPSLPINFGR